MARIKRNSERAFVEDLTAFYIPEEVIARISSALFIKYKMASNTATQADEYKKLCQDIFKKTGLQVMLIYCHKNVTDVIGGSIETKMNFIKCDDGTVRVWGSPEYDILNLAKLSVDYGRGYSIQEMGLMPFRWTPMSRPDGSPVYP